MDMFVQVELAHVWKIVLVEPAFAAADHQAMGQLRFDARLGKGFDQPGKVLARFEPAERQEKGRSPIA